MLDLEGFQRVSGAITVQGAAMGWAHSLAGDSGVWLCLQDRNIMHVPEGLLPILWHAALNSIDLILVFGTLSFRSTKASTGPMG